MVRYLFCNRVINKFSINETYKVRPMYLTLDMGISGIFIKLKYWERNRYVLEDILYCSVIDKQQM